MPLPKDADDFLDLATKKLKKEGIIHLYDFEREEDIPEKQVEIESTQGLNYELDLIIEGYADISEEIDSLENFATQE